MKVACFIFYFNTSQKNNTVYFSICHPSALITQSIRPLKLSTSPRNFLYFGPSFNQWHFQDYTVVVSDSPQFPTWTKRWSPLGWDSAMKEFLAQKPWIIVNIPSLGFVGGLRGSTVLFVSEIFVFKVLFHITHIYISKMSSMYTFVLTLAPCFTKFRGDHQVFDTAVQPWQMPASGSDKRLTCLQ